MLTAAQVKDAHGSFTAYAQIMIPLFNYEFAWNFHHFAICDEFERALNGEYSTLLMSIAPQSGKTCLTNLFISYYIAKYPKRSVLYCTYNSDRAEAYTKNELMGTMFSDNYRQLFPHIKFKFDLDEEENTTKNKLKRKKSTLTDRSFSILVADKDGKINQSDNKRGRFLAAGVGQGIAGTPAHLIVVDDALASKSDADSEVMRRKTRKWVKNDVLSRAQPNATKVFINTRWHSEDPIGMMLEEYENQSKLGNLNYPKPTYVNFPAKLEAHHERHRLDNRLVGEYLWNVYLEKYAIAQADEEEWFSLYQGEPMDTRGVVLKAEHIKLYDWYVRPLQPYISIDANFKSEAEKSDDAAITVWVTVGADKFLIDAVVARIDFVMLLAVVTNLINKYPDYAAVIIEEKANGRALYEMLRRKFARCIVYNVGTNSKMERFQWCLPEFLAGNVYLPLEVELPIVREIKRQLLAFNGAKGAKDDAVDSISQFLNWLRNNTFVIDGMTANLIDRNSSTILGAIGDRNITQAGVQVIDLDISSMMGDW